MDRDDLRIYVRGLLYIMGKAFDETYKESKIAVQYALSNALYCEAKNIEITGQVISNIKNKMQEIINKDLEIRKVSMTKEEAEEFYKKEQTNKGRLQLIDAKQKENITLYYCEDYYNYFYGWMPKSTGAIKVFDIIKYNDGFLIRYPDRRTPDRLEEFKENKKILDTFKEYEDINKILNVNTIYNLNTIIKEDKIEDLIITAEALHEKKIAEIANKICESKRRVILIAGPSSSGKTTFAQRLGIQLKLNRITPVTLSADNYFVERENTPKDEFGNYDFECIEAMDLELFNKQLLDILAGNEVEVPTFNFKEGKKEYTGNKVKLKEDQVLIIEGIHCLNPKFSELVEEDKKFKVYVSALTVLNVDYYNRISTTDNRIIRRIVRDSKYRSHKAIDTLKNWYSLSRGEEKYIFPYQENADYIFNSSLVYELGVLRNYILPLLEEIDENSEEYKEARRLRDFISYFEPIPEEYIPRHSIIREFIGGGCFYR